MLQTPIWISKRCNFNNIDVSCQNSIKMIVDLYQTSANCLRNYSHNSDENNPRWDTQCENAKREKLYALNKFRASPSHLNLTEYKSQWNRLKTIVKDKKLKYAECQKNKLLASRNDPKTFWNTVKKIRNRNITPNKISLESWFEHFKNLLLIPIKTVCKFFSMKNPPKMTFLTHQFRGTKWDIAYQANQGVLMVYW